MALTVFTVYTSPSDYPGQDYVVRRWYVHPNGRKTCDLHPVYVGNDLTAARQAIPKKMINVGRMPADMPVVCESWV